MSMASGDSACAADTHLAVEALSLPSRCSATIRTLDMGKTSCGAGFNPPSESVGAADGGSGPALQEALLLQCGNQFGRVLHHHAAAALGRRGVVGRSEEHTSEFQSLMRISYAVFCLKKKTIINKKET